jgi:hypothetical protein
MRRKTSPARFERNHQVRGLRPARSSALLPTAAALAFALGCSAPNVDVGVADPATKAKVETPPAVSAAPSAKYIEPAAEPYELDGDVVSVKPVPVTPSKPVK